MHQTSHEIVILKPTSVFLAFLTAQLPEKKLPNLRLLQIDNTAYLIPKRESDEETIDYIEQHFLTIFHHEICRWLGNEIPQQLKMSFLDFLCCFKLELHNHIILMEQGIENGTQLLAFKPRQSLLNWIKTVAIDDDLADVIERVELANLQENATVMVKNFTNLTEIKPFIKNYYQPIFTTAMSRISPQSSKWPKVHSFQEFTEYFAVEIHTQLIHLHH